MIARLARVRLPTAVLVSLLIMAAVGIVHWMLGRPLICKCGYVQLFWYGPRGAPEESQHIFDLYSVTHVVHGLIFYFLIWLFARGRISLGLGLIIATLIEGTWEMVENGQWLISRYGHAGAEEYGGDSAINSMADMVAMASGFLFAAWAPVWASVVLLFGTELGLLWLIRDNLTLNIINLIRPNEKLIEWQSRGG